MSDKKNEVYRQKNNKNLSLIIGVSLITFMVAVLWILNFRQIIFQPPASSEVDRQYWQQLQAELDEDLQEFTSAWEDVQTSEELAQGEELIDQIKERIESDLANELATSTLEFADEQFNSEEDLLDVDQPIENIGKLPVVESDKITNCPEFINCMPGPDRVGPCVVPPGCEEITLIAY